MNSQQEKGIWNDIIADPLSHVLEVQTSLKSYQLT